MTSSKKELSLQQVVLAIFDRPFDDITVPKGSNRVIIRLPNEERWGGSPEPPPSSSVPSTTFSSVVPDRFGPLDPEQQFFDLSEEKNAPPDIEGLLSLDRHAVFSVFNDRHRQLAQDLINLLLDVKETKHFLSYVAYIRDRVNPSLVMYAVSVVLLHREDTSSVRVPPLFNVFPDKFLSASFFGNLHQTSKRRSQIIPTEEHQRIPVLTTASDLNVENRMAYFREDLGVNNHHYHWHLVYPNMGRLVDKDRRGELFYFMHQQILARYNADRLSNNLLRVKGIVDIEKPIQEAYFPNLFLTNSLKNWGSRQKNTVISDVQGVGGDSTTAVQNLKMWRDRIYGAIHRGVYETASGDLKKFNDDLSIDKGIDTLGNMVEASALSPNRALYGNLHNMGHVLIAKCHDPESAHVVMEGVMYDTATAVRDPVFFRWHTFIDDIFQEYKRSLAPYTDNELDFTGIEVKSVIMKTKNRAREDRLFTFMEEREMKLSQGLDLGGNKPVIAVVRRLNHEPFEYNIKVENKMDHEVEGTVRIFLAPKFDERNEPFTLTEQRRLMMEMDRFKHKFTSGENTINRNSEDSTLTIPAYDGSDMYTLGEQSGGDVFCDCGWPQNMLLPMGRPAGYQCQLFLMVSNGKQDKVENTSADAKCLRRADIFCGVKGQRYPDRRPMGFPFDRSINVSHSRFLQGRPNMVLKDISILHEDQKLFPGFRYSP